ncbi:hypothetical protein GEV33_006514 [Tenebrio molitor]|uniref:Uncharacterized protein n=1 Tax=Tenebrio molitor TaxID=7067 RepID=A0A8J6LD93_TENMO|nr:hypothetical protein GEV33_006514 [Tenebrio molitor]
MGKKSITEFAQARSPKRCIRWFPKAPPEALSCFTELRNLDLPQVE